MVKDNWFMTNWWALIGATPFSSVPSCAFVRPDLKPSKDFWENTTSTPNLASHADWMDLQRNKDTVRCGMRRKEVPGHRRKKLATSLDCAFAQTKLVFIDPKNWRALFGPPLPLLFNPSDFASIAKRYWLILYFRKKYIRTSSGHRWPAATWNGQNIASNFYCYTPLSIKPILTRIYILYAINFPTQQS